MKIKEDYSYLTGIDRTAIELNVAQIAVHSIRLDRYFSEEEKIENQKEHEKLSDEEWGKRCENFAQNIANQNEIVLNAINDKITLGQYKRDPYEKDYDAWFWCNCKCNLGYSTHENGRCLDYCTLTLNEKMSIDKQNEIVKIIMEIIKQIDTKNNIAIIQYHAVYDNAKIKNIAENFAKQNINKVLTYNNKKGRLVERDYGFVFIPLRVKKYYYNLPYEQLFEMSLENNY